MRIREIAWQNYRRLPDATIRVRQHLVLVGPNDTGKSSVLRAINLCIGVPGAQLAASMEARDFTDSSQPVVLRVVLDGIEDDDRAAFPDEISTIDGETLTIEVEATVLSGDDDQTIVRRGFPAAGHGRSPSRLQIEQVGWAYVPASRSLYRELGSAASGAVRTLLSSIDLKADKALFDGATDSFRTALKDATALVQFRTDLAGALSSALPRDVVLKDVELTSDAELLQDPFAGVTITVKDGGHQAPLAEQSDGVRAMSVLALIGMAKQGSVIVGVDEPEIHLHPGAQRSLAARMRNAPGQTIIATHSASIVREMNPLDIVAMGPDRTARQLPDSAPMAEIEQSTRHWSPSLIEPLTAKAVLLVEGPSDRIICEAVAELLDIDLNRRGVCVFEMDGCGLFARVYELFGPSGFGLPVFGLLDEDARTRWAGVIGSTPAQLGNDPNFAVCAPDLEDVYVRALGAARVVELLLASPNFNETSVRAAHQGALPATLTEDQLIAYCGHEKRKVRASLAISMGMTRAEAAKILPVAKLVRAAST